MKLKEYKSGALVTFDKSDALYEVRLRAPNGELRDKVRCDDYRMAMDYWKSFNLIARSFSA